MAVLPPYVINETKPASTDLISQHPVDERAFRDTVESWLTQISDPATGLLRTDAFGSGGFTLTSTDAGATEGPPLTLFRNSASPAASDVVGIFKFTGKNSAAETVQYADLVTVLTDVTDGSEDAELRLRHIVAGTIVNKIVLNTTGVALTGAVSVSGALTLGTALAVAEGGTGSTTASGARTNLGLGTMATQNSSAVTITGGNITGVGNLTAASLTATNDVFAGASQMVFRPNGIGSTSGQAILSGAGLLTAPSITGTSAVRSGAALFQTNGDISGTVWAVWGSNSAWTAINAQIEARGDAYRNSAVAISAAAVPTNYANLTTNQTIGSYAFLRQTSGALITAGAQINGGQLQWSGSDESLGGTLSGSTSWRAMGTGTATLMFRYA